MHRNACLLSLLITPMLLAESIQRWEGPANAPETVVAGWHDDRNWRNFTAPVAGNSALLGWDASFNTDPPTYVYLGDYRPLSGGPVIAGGPVSLIDLKFESGAFVVDGRSFNVVGGGSGSLAGSFFGVGQTLTSTGLPGSADLRLVHTPIHFGIGGIGSQPGTSGTLLLDGVETTLDFANHVVVGNQGDGEVHVVDGAAMTAPWLHLAEFDQTLGSVQLHSGSFVGLGEHLNLGVRGLGVLEIHSGASLMNQGWTRAGDWPGGHGRIVVSGSGSTMDTTWLELGAQGTGSLNVGDGGELHLSEFLSVAAFQGSLGDAYLSDNSTLTVGTGLIVGRNGSGSLAADDGSSVRAKFCFVGDLADGWGSLGLVGNGTILTVADDDPTHPSGELSIGRLGNGSLNVADGAEATARYVNVGAFSSGDGTVVVGGPGSLLRAIDDRGGTACAELSIGRNGTGRCDILAGGAVTACFGNAGIFNGGEGHLLISGSGSQCVIDQSFTVGAPGPNGGGLGTVEARESGHMSIGGGLWLGNGSEVTVDASASITTGDASFQAGQLVVGPGGGLFGVGKVSGDVAVDGGYVAPGYPIGDLEISGDLSMVGGTFGVELGAGSDRILVSGHAQLGGTLRVDLAGDLNVRTGDEFVVVSATTVSGTFDSLLDLTPYELDIVIAGGTVKLVARASDLPCPDATGDGLVGLDDLAAILAVFGTASGDANWDATADIDQDGAVGLSDLASLIAVFGSTC